MTRMHTNQEVLDVIAKRSRQNLLTGCREWLGTKHSKGYGCIRFNRKMEKVHRVIWELMKGPIPEGMHVLHACDNPECCEINHLELGTNRDNINDKLKRDRGGRKLNTAKALEIIELVKSGMKQKEVGEMFGVTQQTVSRVASAKRWAHLQATVG